MADDESAFVAWAFGRAAADLWQSLVKTEGHGVDKYGTLDAWWQRREGLLRSSSSSPPSMVSGEWQTSLQQGVEQLANEAGAIAVSTVTRVGGALSLAGAEGMPPLGPRTTVVMTPSAALVHVWQSRREARRYHEAQRRWSQSLAEVKAPHKIRVSPAVLVAHGAQLVTVTWLPRALSDENVPLRSGSVTCGVLELSGEHIRAEGAPYVLCCADGTLNCVGTPSTFARVSLGRRVPLRLTAARELSSGFKNTSEASADARVAARLERACGLLVAAVGRAGASVEQMVFEGQSAAFLHACGLNVNFLGQLLARPEVPSGGSGHALIRGEMMARALKAHVATVASGAGADVVEAINDTLRQFASEKVGVLDAVSKVARTKFSPRDATFAFSKSDVKTCGGAAVAFVAQRMGLTLSATGDSVVRLETVVMDVSGVIAAAPEALSADATTKFAVDASATKLLEALSDTAAENRTGNCARGLVRLSWSEWAQFFSSAPREDMAIGTSAPEAPASSAAAGLLEQVPTAEADAVSRAVGVCLRRDTLESAPEEALRRCFGVAEGDEATVDASDGWMASVLWHASWRLTNRISALVQALECRLAGAQLNCESTAVATCLLLLRRDPASIDAVVAPSLQLQGLSLFQTSVPARIFTIATNLVAASSTSIKAPGTTAVRTKGAAPTGKETGPPPRPALAELKELALPFFQHHLLHMDDSTVASIATCLGSIATDYATRHGDRKPDKVLGLWHRHGTVAEATKIALSFAALEPVKRTEALWTAMGSAVSDLLVAMLQSGWMEEALQAMALWQGVVEREAVDGFDEVALAPLERVMGALTQVRGHWQRWVTRMRQGRMLRSRDLLEVSDALEAARVRVALGHIAHVDLKWRGFVYRLETAQRADYATFETKQRQCIVDQSAMERVERNIRVATRREEVGRWNALLSLEFEFRVTATRETLWRVQTEERDILRWMLRSKDRFINDRRLLVRDEEVRRKEIVDQEGHDWPFTLYACSVLASIIINRGISTSLVPAEFRQDLVRISLLSDAQLPMLVKKGALSEAAKKVHWDEDVQRGAISSSESVFRNSIRRNFQEQMPARVVMLPPRQAPVAAARSAIGRGGSVVVVSDEEEDSLTKDMKELWMILKAKTGAAADHSPAPFATQAQQTKSLAMSPRRGGKLAPMPNPKQAPVALPPGPPPASKRVPGRSKYLSPLVPAPSGTSSAPKSKR